jgi:GTPase SAR1 family protein
MSNTQEAQELEQLLNQYRSTLQIVLEQIALLGGKAYAFPAQIKTVEEQRSDIQATKQRLRQLGVVVQDHYYDQENKLENLPTKQSQPLLLSLFGFKPPTFTPNKDLQNRQALIEYLCTNYQDALEIAKPNITLSLLGHAKQTKYTPPRQGSMREHFYKYKQQFVLLGPTGSGKTILLHQLARDLLEEAKQDETKPVPVIFSLANWRPKQSLQDWMLQDLAQRLNKDPAQIKRFFDADLILPLFDDLNSIARFEARLDCARELQSYQEKAHELRRPMVLACSEELYRDLDELQLHAEVRIQAVGAAEIETHLREHECKMLLQILERQENLQLVVQSPLFLHMLVQEYTDQKLSQSLSFSGRDIGQEILETCIQKRFSAAQSREHPIEEMQAFLGWLAAAMLKQGNRQHFYLEQLDGSWLPSKAWQLSFLGLKVLVLSLLGLSAVGLVYLVIGLLGLWLNLGWTLVGAGVALGLLLWLRLELEDMLVTERLDWSWRALRVESATALKAGAITGLLASVACLGFLSPLQALGFGMSAGLLMGMIMLIPHGLIKEEQPSARQPNQKISFSGHNALLAWLIFGSFNGLWIGLLVGIVLGLAYGWLIGLVSGAITGLVAGGLIGFFAGMLRYGGLAYLQHYLLRWILTLSTPAPLRLITWLELAQKHNLLIRAEGGYRFQHKLFQEQIARFGPEGTAPKRAANEQESQSGVSPA